MARVCGQYRKMLLEEQFRNTTNPCDYEESANVRNFRIQFYICLILFVCFVLMDYSDAKIMDISSQQIIDTILNDQMVDLKITNLWEMF